MMFGIVMFASPLGTLKEARRPPSCRVQCAARRCAAAMDMYIAAVQRAVALISQCLAQVLNRWNSDSIPLDVRTACGPGFSLADRRSRVFP